MTERERLAKIEADQQNLAREAETVRRGLRAHYGKLATELPVERLSEREFRDVLGHAIRVGGAVAIAALKGLAAVGVQAESSPAPSRKRGTLASSGGDDAQNASSCCHDRHPSIDVACAGASHDANMRS